MTLKSNWNILSDNENSQESFWFDCDSKFDLSPQVRYPIEECTISTLNKLSINQIEPPMTRLRTKTIEKPLIIPETPSKEKRPSTIQHTINSFTDMTTTLTNSILLSKQDLSNNQFENSSTNGINILTDWFESCSLNESKCKNDFWSSHKTDNYNKYSIQTPSSNVTYSSNPFSKSNTSSLFDQQQTQLWSRFHFTTSTIQNNLAIEQYNLTSSDIFISSNKNFSNQSSPSQIVPSLLTNTSSSIIQETLSPQINQCQIRNSEFLNKKEDFPIQQSSSKVFFTLIIFVFGLVFGYLFTNTFSPNLFHHWFFVIWEKCMQISVKYFYLLYIYLQTVMKYFSSFILL
ncbi:unnamed protein product [Rotaria sordida]|uniref:Transmembrane protein n=1 Tax=Rotaria sordida TaxID=392033 RepID=A0A815CSZ3_9BILA|nr:unnamed protein product [Rotaria sordida]CAF1288008.1 unnamed protein product [Rotaria sordida]